MPADSTTPILSLSICHFFKQWSLGLWSTPFYIVDPNHVGTYSLVSNVTHRSIETRLLIGQSVGLEQHAWTPKYFGTERNTSNSPNGGSCQKCILQLNHWIYFCFQIGLIQIKHTPVSGFGLILLNTLVCIFYHIIRALITSANEPQKCHIRHKKVICCKFARMKIRVYRVLYFKPFSKRRENSVFDFNFPILYMLSLFKCKSRLPYCLTSWRPEIKVKIVIGNFCDFA